jgi:5-methyltetrahydrofolate--homocysteine methyltransferase
MTGKNGILKELRTNVVLGRVDQNEDLYEEMTGQPGVVELTTRCLEDGVPVKDILYEALISGMDEVGSKYEAGEYYLPDLIASADAMIAGTDILKPYLLKEDIQARGKVLMATVEGDEHDIGKNLVIIMLRAAGFNATDLGTRVPTAEIVKAVREQKPDVLGLSALLTSTMPHMKETIEVLKKENLRDSVHVMVGGAPVSKEYADSIGADAYGEDAFEAVERARDLVAAVQ